MKRAGRIPLQQQKVIMWHMVREARRLTEEDVPPPQIVQAVGHLRDELKRAVRSGVILVVPTPGETQEASQEKRENT